MKTQSPIRQYFRVILDFEFGNSTFLIVYSDEAPTEVRLLMESEMVGVMALVLICVTWEDFSSSCSLVVLSSELCEHPEGIYQV